MSAAIPREQWIGFCESFTLSHAGWLVTIEERSKDRQRVLVEQEPLRAVSAELEAAENDGKILISTGSEPIERTFQTVKHPVGLTLEQSPSGEDKGLTVESRDGRVTMVRFRAPARPQDVDGAPPAA